MNAFNARLIQSLFRLQGLLPLGWLRALGGLLGRAFWLWDSRLAQVTRRNINACFPELTPGERTALARSSLQQTACTMLEIPAVWQWPYAKLQAHMRVEGLEHFRSAQAAGRGVIVLAPHHGNWEVLGLYLAELGEVTSLYQPPKQAAVESVVRSAREKTGAKLVPTNRAGVAALLKALKAGGISGILPDQVPLDEASGVYAPFFGHPALTMKLIHSLLKSTGARAVTGFARRTPGGWTVTFLEADPGLYDADPEAACAALNRSVERAVRLCPEQYQWEYKRFREQPAGDPKFYRKLPGGKVAP